MEIEKNKRIKEELDRITALIMPMDRNELAALSALLQNLAFMTVSLQDLQETINETGVVERYQNGKNQHGLKPSAAVQAYNALIKNYNMVVKSIMPYVKPEKKQNLASIVSAHKTGTGVDESSRTSDVINMLRREAGIFLSWAVVREMVGQGLTDEEILQKALEMES